MADEMTLMKRGLFVGFFPTIAMFISTFLLSKFHIHILIEAALQNFASGLIIAAVASELFPVMIESNDEASYLGISVGFFIGLSVIYGVKNFVYWIEPKPKISNEEENRPSYSSEDSLSQRYEPIASTDSILSQYLVQQMSWEEDDVERASLAMSDQSHRDHLASYLRQMHSLIKSIEEKSYVLCNEQLNELQKEEINEQVDESIYLLKYKLNHSRKLLQASDKSVDLEKNTNLERNIGRVRATAEYLLEPIRHHVLDKDVVRKMRTFMDQMEKQIASLHDYVESSSRWHRSMPRIETNDGDTLPMGLVLPVCLDGLCDGFLIGISSVISMKAGIILSFANSLEMSFLGMAYSARLRKCTGSTVWARNIALYSPPFIMFCASGIGAAVGSSVQALPALFIGMVSFGAVALLFLVTNELLIEARSSQGEDDYWYITIMVFVGVFLVLVLDHVL